MSPEPVSYAVRVVEDPADREACFAVRKEVVVAEQGVPEDLEYDAYDAVAVHVLAVRDDGVPLGAGRLLFGEAAAGKTGGASGVGSLGRLAVGRDLVGAEAGPHDRGRAGLPAAVAAMAPGNLERFAGGGESDRAAEATAMQVSGQRFAH